VADEAIEEVVLKKIQGKQERDAEKASLSCYVGSRL